MSSAVRACSNSVRLWMNRSTTSNSRRASCRDVCVFCLPDSTNTDQYFAPTQPSRNRGMSAHSVGCTLLISNDVKSPAFVSRNIDGRSLCVSMKGALFNSALARSSNFGSGVSASSLARPMPANAQLARTAETALRLVCSIKRRRDIKVPLLRMQLPPNCTTKLIDSPLASIDSNPGDCLRVTLIGRYLSKDTSSSASAKYILKNQQDRI